MRAVLRSKALKVQHAQVVRMGVARVQRNSPLKGLGKRECSLVMTKTDEVIEVESLSHTRDDSEIEIRGRAHKG